MADGNEDPLKIHVPKLDIKYRISKIEEFYIERSIMYKFSTYKLIRKNILFVYP